MTNFKFTCAFNQNALFVRKAALIAVAGLAALTVGCTTVPQPIPKAEVAARVAADRKQMYADQEPLSGPLSFSDVAARAIKYNLDYRMRMMDGALSQSLLEVSRWDMLPKLLVNAGYSQRSNDNASRSLTIEPNTLGPFHSTSQERGHRLAGAEFSWNVLDLAVSYYRSKQMADQVLVAQERQRKVVQNILQDTRVAYWRALGAQRMSAQLDQLLVRTESALERARQIEKQGLWPQAQSLAYQMALLDATSAIQTRRQELELARLELAALMNLAPGTQFVLAEDKQMALPAAPNGFGELEELALNQRPELREEDYKKRISANDIRRQIASTLPGLSLDFGAQNDSNKYLLNNSWVDSGVRLSTNLFRLASIPSILRAGEAQESVDTTRRMAQAMAILTQVRVASVRYGLALSELKQVSESADVAGRLATLAKSSTAAKADSVLEQTRAEARAMLYDYQRYVAYASAQAAWGRLYNTLGLDVIPAEGASLKEISSTIDKSMREWQGLTFRVASNDDAPLPAVRVAVDHSVTGPNVASIKEGVALALERHQVKVSQDSSSDAKEARLLTVNWKIETKTDSNPQATVDMVLLNADGTVAKRGSFTTAILNDMTQDRIRMFVQAAVDANISAIVDGLRISPVKEIAKATTVDEATSVK
jgi:outer membrane protein TolC